MAPLITGKYSQTTEFPSSFGSDERGIVALLMTITGFGENHFWRLVRQLQTMVMSLTAFWELPSQKQKIFVGEKIAKSILNTKKEYKNTDYFACLAKQHISVIIWGDTEYPELLKTITVPPPVLYVRGQLCSSARYVAVIGSRKMTAYGKVVIERFIPELCQAGLQIVSGAVVGVDRTAQQVTLDCGGQTVAVLGHGLLAQTSFAEQQLLDHWLSQGACLLSNFAPRVTASKGTFLARNRIVAGMSLGVLVVEAATQSGTLHTVRWAAEFGRTVLAVPGSVFSPFAVGTAELVNQGASLAIDARSVLQTLQRDWSTLAFDLDRDIQAKNQAMHSGDDQPDQQIKGRFSDLVAVTSTELGTSLVQILQSEQWQYDALIAQLQSKWPINEILTTLTQLELTNQIVRKGEWIMLSK